MEDKSNIYLDRTHPEDMETLYKLTQPKCWDYPLFRRVLVAIGSVGNGQAIPAPNRPDSIHLQGWRQYIDDLVTRTKTTGREHARVVFVDTERKSLVVSGKITIGTATETRLDTTKEQGRERFQRRIVSFHTHPTANGSMTAHGLSDQDYRTFLPDPEQQVMLIAYGENNLMMVMKTSVTPNNLSKTLPIEESKVV